MSFAHKPTFQQTNRPSTCANPRQSMKQRLLLSAEKLPELLVISVRTLWRLRAANKVPWPVRRASYAKSWSSVAKKVRFQN
jgi:hypothetical protein